MLLSQVPCRLAYRHGTTNLTKSSDNISVDNNVNINLSAGSIYILFNHILWATNGISLSKKQHLVVTLEIRFIKFAGNPYVRKAQYS